MKRETLYSIMHALLTTVAHVEYHGTENLPPSGPVLVVTNHMSRMDTMYLFINPARKDLTALVADKYLKYPIFSDILKIGGVVWLDRDTADFSAFRKAIEVIRSGVAMGIAPEGTRSTNGQLQVGKPGAVLLGSKTGVPIVPVGIAGTEDYFKRVLTLRRPQVTLRFGPVFHLPAIDRSRRDEQMQEFTDEIMCRIGVLLPPKYWGVYQNHPRLLELIRQQGQVK